MLPEKKSFFQCSIQEASRSRLDAQGAPSDGSYASATAGLVGYGMNYSPSKPCGETDPGHRPLIDPVHYP